MSLQLKHLKNKKWSLGINFPQLMTWTPRHHGLRSFKSNETSFCGEHSNASPWAAEFGTNLPGSVLLEVSPGAIGWKMLIPRRKITEKPRNMAASWFL